MNQQAIKQIEDCLPVPLIAPQDIHDLDAQEIARAFKSLQDERYEEDELHEANVAPMNATITHEPIPQDTIDTITLYVQHGAPAGSFITAVLCNNLLEAYKRADYRHRRCLWDVVEYCYQIIPCACWGSVEAVDAWMQQGGMQWIRKGER